MQDVMVSLEDLIPMRSEIQLNGKTYFLRKINIEDEVWMKQFGDLEALMRGEDMRFLSKLTFRLLEDKSDFLPVEAEGYDDDGNKIKISKTGPMRILESMGGMKQKYDLIASLMQTFGMSRPKFDKLVEESLKKNGITENPSQIPIGEKSGTP